MGSRSYLIQSLNQALLEREMPVILFGSQPDSSTYVYEEVGELKPEKGDVIVVVATPSKANAHLGVNRRLLQSLEQEERNKLLISSIHAELDDASASDPQLIEYSSHLATAEEKFLQLKSSQVLRVPHFIGGVESLTDNQKKLMPWAIFINEIFDESELRNPDSKLNFVDEIDLLNAVIESQSHLGTDLFCLLPALNISCRELLHVAVKLRSGREAEGEIVGEAIQTRLTICPDFPGASSTLKNGWHWKSSFSMAHLRQKLWKFIELERLRSE